MANTVKHADDSELQLLVFGDEDSDEYRVTAAHVETCHECQSRLSRMAGSEEFDDEASSMLSGYPASDALHRDSRSETVSRSESLDFLSPPSHPEMLGRLGRYEIERVIGSGGMGVVLKGFDTELNRPIAIKVLARHLAHSGAARQRFARESRAAAAVVHEHVVSIHNVEADGEIPFLVMQYVAGESLQSRVDRDGPLDAKGDPADWNPSCVRTRGGSRTRSGPSRRQAGEHPAGRRSRANSADRLRFGENRR